MKKLSGFLILILLIGLSVSAVGAVDTTSEGPQSMARYFSADTEFFFAMRIDDGFIDEADGMIASVLSKLPPELAADIPQVSSIRQQINEALAEGGTNLAELRVWLGDNVAIGVSNLAVLTDDTSSNDEEAIGYVAIEIKDRVATEAFIQKVAGEQGLGSTTEGDFTIIPLPQQGDNLTGIALGDDVAYIYSDQAAFLRGFDNSLADDADFLSTLQALPESSYHMLGVSDTAPLLTNAQDDELAIFNIDRDTSGSIAFGITIANPYTLIYDVAFINPELSLSNVPRLSREFIEFIPGDASFLFAASNLTNFFDWANTIAQNTPGGSTLEEQLGAGSGFMGIDAREDILSWTTGDYAMFVGLDLNELLQLALNPQGDMSMLSFEAGLVIEATDPDKAKEVATKLGSAASIFLGQQEGVEVRTDTVGDVEVTVIGVTAPLDGGLQNITLEIAIGASDDVFFVATLPSARTIVLRDGNLLNNRDFANAAQYILEQPTSLMYADDNGLLVSTIVPLALIGPAIGNVFDNIVDELETSSVPSITRHPVQAVPDEAIQLLQYFQDVFSSMTVSTSLSDDGTTAIRLVLSYNE